MRFASWNWGGRDHAGIISADGREGTPLAISDAHAHAAELAGTVFRSSGVIDNLLE
jgi:hypothetical protein